MSHYRILGVDRACTTREALDAFRHRCQAADPLHDEQYLSQVRLAYELVMADIEQRVIRRERLKRTGRVLGVMAIAAVVAALISANWWVWAWDRDQQERRAYKEEARTKGWAVDSRRSPR